MADKEEQKELEEKRNRERAREAKKFYEKEREFLLKQSTTSFGKMILADLPSAPTYSIGKSLRPPLYPYKNTPGPKYSQENGGNLKFDNPPSWKIGNATRRPLASCEHYDYYNYKYDEANDLGKIPKKWDHIKGGAPALDPRIKYDFSEKVPGPGRYDPNYLIGKRKMPTYFLGIKGKGSSIDISTGTGINVAPWTYKVDNVTTLSQHSNFPSFTFQKDNRKDLGDKLWTKHESYYVYSSIGNQVMTHKPTMPIESFTKSTRDTAGKCGVFKSMMERQPQKIKIDMPKF